MLQKSSIVQPGQGSVIPSPAAPQGISSTLMSLVRMKQQRDDAFAKSMSSDYIGGLNEAGTKIQQEALDAFSTKWNTKYKDQRRLSTQDKIELAKDKNQLTRAQANMMASQRNYQAQMKKLETDQFGKIYKTPEEMPEIDWADPNKNYLTFKTRSIDEQIQNKLKLIDPDTISTSTQTGSSTQKGAYSKTEAKTIREATDSPEKRRTLTDSWLDDDKEWAQRIQEDFQELNPAQQAKYLKDGEIDLHQFNYDEHGGKLEKESIRTSSAYTKAKVNVVEPRTNAEGMKYWPISTDPMKFTDKPYVSYDENGVRVSPDDIPIVGSGQITEIRQMRTDDSGQRVVPVAQIVYSVSGDGKATPGDQSIESLTQQGQEAEFERQREIEMNEKTIKAKGRRSKEGKAAKARNKVLNSNQYVNQLGAAAPSDINMYNQFMLSQKSTRVLKTIYVPVSELGSYTSGYQFKGIEKTGEAEQMRSLY